MKRSITIIVLALLVLLLSVPVIMAEEAPGATSAAAPMSTATVLNYRFDLVTFKDNGNNTSTWTYAVTADGNEGQALSHWTLGIQGCYGSIVAPANNSLYTTLTSPSPACSGYNCQVSTCTAVHGKDATTGVSGIKFQDCSPQLDGANTPRTHVFQFTVQGVPTDAGPVDVAGKAGSAEGYGTILGPACQPTAVSVRGLTAVAQGGTDGFAALAYGLFAAVLLGVWYRAEAALQRRGLHVAAERRKS